MIGCPCATCHSTDPRDRRLRPSIYLDVANGPKVLIDAGTDLRQQALTHGVSRVDAILLTHSHADHIMGLDDVRRFNIMQGGAIPAYADARTSQDVRRTFEYIFVPPTQQGGGVPQIHLTTIETAFAIDGLQVVPVPVVHGQRPVLGFRFGSFAYLTDCNHIPDQSWPLIEKLDVLVLDALRHRVHPTHYSVAQALDVAARVKPRRTLLTHMCHDLPHQATNDGLPSGVELAYDGLVVDVDVVFNAAAP